MKQLILAAILASFAAPASAGLFKNFEDFSKETQDFLEGWANRIGPSIEAFGPQLEALLDRVDDWSLYELPEVLPNGDIIIRRKQPKQTPPALPPETKEEGIDL